MRLALLAFITAAIFLALAVVGVVRVSPRTSSPPAIVLPAASSARVPVRSERLRRQAVRLKVESARWLPR